MLSTELHSFYLVLVKRLQSSSRVKSHSLIQHHWYFVLHSEDAVLLAGTLSVIWHQWGETFSWRLTPGGYIKLLLCTKEWECHTAEKKEPASEWGRKKKKVDRSAADWHREGRLLLIQQKQVSWHAALMGLQHMCQLQLQTLKKTNKQKTPPEMHKMPTSLPQALISFLIRSPQTSM